MTGDEGWAGGGDSSTLQGGSWLGASESTFIFRAAGEPQAQVAGSEVPAASDSTSGASHRPGEAEQASLICEGGGLARGDSGLPFSVNGALVLPAEWPVPGRTSPSRERAALCLQGLGPAEEHVFLSRGAGRAVLSQADGRVRRNKEKLL